MRAGIVLAGFTSAPPADFIAAAREAETRGYHTAWLGEVSGYDAIVMSTVVATHTETLLVANGVLPVQTRTPVILGHGHGVAQPPGARALRASASGSRARRSWSSGTGSASRPSLAQIRETWRSYARSPAASASPTRASITAVKGFR
jgi:hypothetical protein